MMKTFEELTTLERLEQIEGLLTVNARRSVIEGLIPEVRTDRMLRDRMAESRRRILKDSASPRGKALTWSSPKFLSAQSDRYQASILVALAHRVQPPQRGSVAHAAYLAAVYKAWGSRLIADQAQAGLSFNDFVVAMDGLAAGEMKTERCGVCGSQYLRKRSALGKERSCPFCDLHRTRLGAKASARN